MKTIYSIAFLFVVVLCARAGAPQFKAVEIDAQIAIGYGLAIADVDGDGKKDILLADKNHIVWYRNPDWQKFVMAERLTELDHVCIAAQDIDGDGKAEVAVGAGWNPGDTLNSGSVHFLIAPEDRTQRWQPVALPHEPTVHRMRWVPNSEGRFELVVVPLHGRGNRGGQGDGVRILAYDPPQNPRNEWKTTLIDDALHMTHNFDPVFWRGGRGADLLVAAREGVFLLQRQGQGWVREQLGGGEPGAGEIRHGKLPGGRRYIATVEPMHGNQAVVYLQPRESGKPWERRVLDENIVDGHAVGCGDLIGAGHDQLVVGWRAMNRPGVKVGIKMYLPKDAEGNEWDQVLIDDNTMACEDLALADLDGDGRLDIIAAGRATKNVKIYFNQGVK